MESQIQCIAVLANIDQRLDELLEDYGDLPDQINKIEFKVNEKKVLVEETQAILDEIKKFVKQAKVTLVDLKEKEERLAEQQFKVRNNKEFDAITNEIEHLKSEHEKLSDRLRTEGVKQENLMNILEGQMKDMEDVQKELDDKYDEAKKLSGDQNEELTYLQNKRLEVIDMIKTTFVKDYERIRSMHRDAAVIIKKNSCSGCFSAIPAQIIVEVRNNPNHTYYCENCGRLLLPDDILVGEIF
ncbi:MAG: C4-type zinc ribbon domain-containing protein [Candidatus Kapaibacterium sp.]|jgi:predicted  nucleic acid-binding Zn-ribbon protein|nr:C4-type zinc ribbon domain-containing protein [Candidatus Kapabacteria bacterium]